MAGIQFAVHTYGHFDAMFYVLNGIKMIMDSDFTGSLIKLIALVATSYYALRGMAESIEGRTTHYLLKTVGMLMLISALIMPKADMLVVDRISGKKEVISGLPYAFVLPVGALEAIGAGITSLFEQAFTPVSSMAYKDYGLIFGQRLVQESKNWRINNPEFASNMNVFIKRCVVLEAMIGNRFTPDDIFNSSDIFSLVTQNAGTFRQVDFSVNKRHQRVNCLEAGKILKTYLKPEIDFLNFKYKGTDFAIAGGSGIGNILNTPNTQINSLLTRNIEAGYASSLGVNTSAADIIRQNLMINALKDWGNINDKYGYTRADDLQKSNWKISGELAKEYLPILLNIMKGLIYASFIFIVPLMILSGGVAHYLKYCTVVFSLQMWPALNSVLNLFIELYGNLRGANLTGGALTFANFNQSHDSVDAIVLVASGLQMSIPFLSFAIVQGGVSSFMNLASSMQGASSAAAGTASSEITSGNRSFDNINKDTQSLNNKSGFKTDFNQLYQEGASQIQREDGSVLRNFADSTMSIASGGGINKSSGSRAVVMEEGKNMALHEGYTQGLNSMLSIEQHYQQSQSSAISAATDRVAHLAQRQAAGESINYDTTTEEGRAMQQLVNNTVSLHDRDGHGWNQASKASVNGYIEAGASGSAFGIKGSTGVKGEVTASADNTSTQSLEKGNLVNQERGTSRSLNTLLRAASNKHYTKDDAIDQSLAQSTRASYDQMQSYGKALSQKREEVESYSSALQAVHSRGSSDRRDMTHELEMQVAKQYGVSQEDAHKMVQSYDPRANRVWDSMVQAEVGMELAQVRASKAYVTDTAANNEIIFASEHQGRVNDQQQRDLQQKASQEGLDINSMEHKIQNTQIGLNYEKQSMTTNASGQINAAEQKNIVQEQGMNQRLQKYEEDRIGQGTVGNFVGIGGPNVQDKVNEYLKNQKAVQIPLVQKKDK